MGKSKDCGKYLFCWLLVIVAGKVPELTPVVVSVGQLVADDGSDPAIVHRPGSRKDDAGEFRLQFSLLVKSMRDS